MNVSHRRALTRSMRPYQLAGFVIVILLVGGLGGWAGTSEIAGAVIAPGAVVVDSNSKKVQHQSGGIVGEILARDGDVVKGGDVLLRLDATITRANLAIIRKRLLELRMRKARLEAERDNINVMHVPAEREDNPEDLYRMIADGERKLFELRRAARQGQKTQLAERASQIRQEITGLEAELQARVREQGLVEVELKGARELWDNRLMPITKLTQMQRDVARIEGDIARLRAQIARARARISETELQIIQIDRDVASDVAKELREIDAQISEFVERRIAAEDQLARQDIRAPQSGTVHQSVAHTIGGVVNGGETIMMIVPEADDLSVEARVAPRDIDQLSVGQEAVLRFTAFSQRTTPETRGTIVRISADTSVDQRTGRPYYTVRIALPGPTATDLDGLKLVPGMPVEVFARTAQRRVISYLIKPFTDQIQRSFREQ